MKALKTEDTAGCWQVVPGPISKLTDETILVNVAVSTLLLSKISSFEKIFETVVLKFGIPCK